MGMCQYASLNVHRWLAALLTKDTAMINKPRAFLAAGAILCIASGSSAVAQQDQYAVQGWTQAERDRWYSTSQGSRLLPEAWFMALELPGSPEKFAPALTTKRYGYLTDYAAGARLPVGFVIDQGFSPDASPERWVGMTCAACHTGEVTFHGNKMRIDGAPTLADYETFIEDFAAALTATAGQPEKFDRFASEVLGTELGAKKDQLKTALQSQADWYSRVVSKSRSTAKYGHGRLDAQGHILNKVSLIAGVPEQLEGYPADAPASYPFLWYAPKQERVQWNGDFTANENLPILRNIGELIGVFGSVDVSSNTSAYPSSVRTDAMNELEDLMRKLQAPSWPDQALLHLPPLASTEAGKALFQTHCAACHVSLDRTTGDPAEPLEPGQTIAQMKPFEEIGTDVWLSCNVYLHRSRAGVFEPLLNKPIANTTEMLVLTIFGVFTNPNPPEAPASSAETQRADLLYASKNSVETPLTRPEREETCRHPSQPDDTLGYKAGPLNGIWATAPYLHNGSVPTLADLLLPAAQRPVVFSVGGTEFDPEHVGFKSGTGDGPFQFRVRDVDGKVIPGNDNSGHDYGTDLSTEDRAALLEYLKSL